MHYNLTFNLSMNFFLREINLISLFKFSRRSLLLFTVHFRDLWISLYLINELGWDCGLHLNLGCVNGWAQQGVIGQTVVRETVERFVCARMNLRAGDLSRKLHRTTAKGQPSQMLVRMYENSNCHAPSCAGTHHGTEFLLLTSFSFVPGF